MTPAFDDNVKGVSEAYETVAGLADRAGAIAGALHLGDRRESIDELGERARASGFQIIFVGEFNSGKSTAINALLGEAVMPMKGVEANAILTMIRYGATTRALLYPVGDGPPTEVPHDEFEQHIVVDRKNRDKASPWAYAELYYPLELLKDGVVVVDPPGTNKQPGREGLTMKEAGKSDAAVVVFTATAPGAQSEMDFVASALDGKECFWLVTRVDNVHVDQRAEVRDALEDDIRRVRPRDDTIAARMFFVNAALAQEAAGGDGREEDFAASGMEAFESALGQFVAGDRHRAKMHDLCTSLERELAVLKSSTETQIRDTQRERKEIDASQDALEGDLEKLGDRAEDALRALENGLALQPLQVSSRVRTRLRTLPDAPPFGPGEITTEGKLTFRMDLNLSRDQKLELIEEIRSQVVRRVASDTRDWLKATAGPEAEAQVAGHLDEFKASREELEQELAGIRASYLELPSPESGSPVDLPELNVADLADVIRTMVRDVSSGLTYRSRMFTRVINAALEASNVSDFSGALRHGREAAHQAFVDRIAGRVLAGIADDAETLARDAQTDVEAWTAKVMAVARAAIKGPQGDLRDTLKAGRETSRLKASEKDERRTELKGIADALAALHDALLGLQAEPGVG
jgi:hypothetical protein